MVHILEALARAFLDAPTKTWGRAGDDGSNPMHKNCEVNFRTIANKSKQELARFSLEALRRGGGR